MCSPGVAKAFRGVYPLVGGMTAFMCLYSVSISPPLHTEVYSTTAVPVNGTLQIIECDPLLSFVLKDGSRLAHCERVVDQPGRLRVDVYHVSMGVPFIACCILGAIFCSLTRKEVRAVSHPVDRNVFLDMCDSLTNILLHFVEQDSTVFNLNNMFTPDTYAPVGGGTDYDGHGGGGGGSSMYTWELVFWGYVGVVHWVLVSVLTSPCDIFDTVVSIGFAVICLMFLCRPRGESRDGSTGTGGVAGLQGLVLSVLLLCTWLTFSSIPHAYEEDRGWLFASMLVMDGLLLFVHMYDSMPTMYTIVMGRLTYVSLVNMWLAFAFYSLDDRLSQYIQAPPSPV